MSRRGDYWYNAVPESAVETLVEFMEDFADIHG